MKKEATLADWLVSNGFDPDDFPSVPIMKEWEQFPIIKCFREYEKQRNA